MFTLKVSGREITQEQYADIDKKFEEEARLIQLFAVKTRFTKQLWMRKHLKHQFKNTKNQGHSHVCWETII